jgi:hypothetical protein
VFDKLRHAHGAALTQRGDDGVARGRRRWH